MPRRLGYSASPPAAPQPSAALGIEQIGAITVWAERAGGVVSPTRLDTARYKANLLAAELGAEWKRQCELAATRYTSARQHYEAINDLLVFCGGEPDAERLSVRRLNPELLDRWEDEVAAKYSQRSATPGARSRLVYATLRGIAGQKPRHVSAELQRRIEGRPLNTDCGIGEPVPDLTSQEVDRLIAAARRSVREVESRIARGRQLAAAGADPRETGKWDLAGLVWLAVRGLLKMEMVSSLGPMSKWDESVRKELGADHVQRFRANRIIRHVYRLVFPARIDLIGHYVLLALDSGAPPECIKDLRLCDIVPIPADRVVEILLRKRRASNERIVRLRDEGPNVAESHRLKDAGTVIRSLLDVTAEARELSGSDLLFIAGTAHQRVRDVEVGPLYWHSGRLLGEWIQSEGLDAPGVTTRHRAAGEVEIELPALSKPWDLRRLRKTTLAHHAVHHPDELALWRDNTPEVFQEHYAVGSTVFRAHVGRLVTRATKALVEHVRSETGITVIRPSAADLLTGSGVNEAARVLRIAPKQVRRLAHGDLDVDEGYAACRDPFKSPYAPADELCRAAKVGLCLSCPNAIVAPQHAVALRRFDEQVIESHRRSLTPPEFAARWIPIRDQIQTVLSEIEQAEDADGQ